MKDDCTGEFVAVELQSDAHHISHILLTKRSPGLHPRAKEAGKCSLALCPRKRWKHGYS